MQRICKGRLLFTLLGWILVSCLVWHEPAFADPPRKTEVLIIGAGLSGMAAAYHLKRERIPYHLLEIAPRVGGRVRTVRYKRPGEPDIYVDSGMEEYWESNPAVEIMRQLKLPHSSDVAVSSIRLGTNLYALAKDESPQQFQQRLFSPEDLQALNKFKTKLASWSKQIRSEMNISPELRKLTEISFADFVRRENLPPKVSDWIRISLECEIGTHWDRISALDGIAEFHIFLGQGEICFRVKGGNDRFTEALANYAGKKNISLHRRVTRVVSNPSGDVTVHYVDTESNEAGQVRCRAVISTIPLFRLFEVQFIPPLSTKKREAIESMSWGSYFKAHIFLPANAAQYWIREGASILPILTDSELGVIYDGNPYQEKPTKVLSLLIHGDAAETYNLVPVDKARSEITKGLEALWPGIEGQIQGMEFYRYHPRAIAAWPVGRSRFDDLSNEIRKPENGVYLAGDFTETSHSDGAFISAERVVRQILQKRGQTKEAVPSPSKF